MPHLDWNIRDAWDNAKDHVLDPDPNKRHLRLDRETVEGDLFVYRLDGGAKMPPFWSNRFFVEVGDKDVAWFNPRTKLPAWTGSPTNQKEWKDLITNHLQTTGCIGDSAARRLFSIDDAHTVHVFEVADGRQDGKKLLIVAIREFDGRSQDGTGHGDPK